MRNIVTASIDTTCTIWDIENNTVETQLIAHEKAVYDVSYAAQDSVFSTVGEDGSVRVFDQRKLDSSSIIYESEAPIFKVQWNLNNPN